MIRIIHQSEKREKGNLQNRNRHLVDLVNHNEISQQVEPVINYFVFIATYHPLTLFFSLYYRKDMYDS